MQISVTGRHMDITDAIRNYAVERVQHDLGIFERIESIHIILDIEKYRHFAEVVVQGKDHIHVEGKEESDDMYASIDGAVEKAARQMRKLKDKVQDHRHREGLGEIESSRQPDAAE